MQYTPSLKPGQASLSPPLRGTLSLPGDKSMSHRALLFGLLARGRSEILGLLEGEDVLATAQAARAFGAQVQKQGDTWTVDGVGAGALLEPEAPLDFGNSGTGARLVMGIAASHAFKTCFMGDSSLCKRPMGRVLTPLKKMGARVLDCGTDEKLPLTILGASLPIPITYELPVASAQVKSAILLAALNTPGRITVIERVPTRDHTERMMKAYGVKIDITTDATGARLISLQGEAKLTAQRLAIPGDPSSAAFAIVAALVIKGSLLKLENIMLNPTRTGLLTTLREMGAKLSIENTRLQGGEEVGDIIVESSPLRGVEVPAERAPFMIDEYPILAVAAAFAEGRSVFYGLGELKVKESDRLDAIYRGLVANGVTAKVEEEMLVIEGARKVKGGGMVATHRDHRISMAFLIMGLASENAVQVDDTSMIVTSFPNFIPLMRSLGAGMS